MLLKSRRTTQTTITRHNFVNGRFSNTNRVVFPGAHPNESKNDLVLRYKSIIYLNAADIRHTRKHKLIKKNTETLFFVCFSIGFSQKRTERRRVCWPFAEKYKIELKKNLDTRKIKLKKKVIMKTNVINNQ